MLNDQKILDGFKAAGDRMDATDEGISHLKKDLENVLKQLKLYGKAVLAGGYQSDQKRKTFWQDEGQAKDFGNLILQVIGRKDMSELDNIGGGFLVNSDLTSVIIDRMGQYGKFRAHATTFPLGTAEVSVPEITSDFTVYCPGEASEKTKSDMTFGQIRMLAKTLACLAAVSRELDEDSIIGVAEIVGISMARSMAKKEDEIGFIGDGTSDYFGMTGITGALRMVSETISEIAGLVVASGNAYSEITLDDFEEVVGLLPSDFDETSKWFMSKRFYHNVVWPLARSQGVANIFEILANRKSRFFLGYEVEFVHCLPYVEANSQICALLGDLQMGAFLGERKVLSIEQSDHVLFSSYQKAILATERVDINAFGVGDTTNPGAIVGLITAAS